MSRVKRGTMHVKKRKNLLTVAKGYSLGRKNLMRRARQAVTKALSHAYVDRRKKKRNSRNLWNIKINAAARSCGLTYSTVIHNLKTHKSILDRKILAHMAEQYPDIFAKIIEQTK